MKRRHACLLAAVGCAAALMIVVLKKNNDRPREGETPKQQPKKTSFSISAAHVIALNTSADHALALRSSIGYFLGLRNVVLHAANRGTAPIAMPLYTRMLLMQGRHSHAELGSRAALGCLLSHMAIWKAMEPNETAAVFEEDAWLDETSAGRLETLHQELTGRPWELLMLEAGHITSTGKWLHHGALLAACNHSATICEWQGSRGYLLTYAGARILLRHAEPFLVQTDALFWLVAAFEPSFRMYWTRKSVAHQSMFSASRTWDQCLKCYIPTFPPLVLGVLLLAAIGTAVVPGGCIYAAVVMRRRHGNRRYSR